MKTKIFKYIGMSFIATILLSGCSNKGTNLDSLAKDDLIYEKPNVSYDDFESELIRVASKAERSWGEYTSLLTQRKELENSKLKAHIPSGMGVITSMEYQGYLGNFLKMVGEKSGYVVEFQNLSVNDTPIMSVKKYKTTLYDILQSVIGMYDYDVKILESEKRMIISIKV